MTQPNWRLLGDHARFFEEARRVLPAPDFADLVAVVDCLLELGPTPEHGCTLDVTEGRGIGPGVWIVPFGAGAGGNTHLLAFKVYRDYPRIRLLSFTANLFE
ncbi:MAG TPA: hypothetical protein VGA36_08940 [Nitriliruptorales bacterium]